MKTKYIIQPVFPQRLVITIQGEDVLFIDQGTDDEQSIPDFGEFFVQAVNAGIFAGQMIAPEECSAKVEKTEITVENQTASWTLWVDAMDLGAFRIIACILQARVLDSVNILTEEVFTTSDLKAKSVDIEKIPYPEIHQPCPFLIDYDPPMKSKDRVVQVEFKTLPPERVVDDLLSIYELWSELLMLGGYPEAGESIMMSGAFPDPPFQLDEVTIEQAFPEFFSADEASFNAIVNYAQNIHRNGDLISKVIIR